MKRFSKVLALLLALMMLSGMAAAMAAPISVWGIASAYIVNSENTTGSGVVTAAAVNVRRAPSTETDTLFRLFEGNEVILRKTVLSTDGFYWYEIDFQGQIGFARADLIERGGSAATATEEAEEVAEETAEEPKKETPKKDEDGITLLPEGSVGVIASTTVNVRKEPSTDADVVAKLHKDEKVTVNGSYFTADRFVWYRVKVNGRTGFIREDLINVTIPGEEGTIPGAVVRRPGTQYIDERKLDDLAEDYAFLTKLDEIEEGARVNGVSAMLTPMEELVFYSLSPREQVLVALACAGHPDEVYAIMYYAQPEVTFSRHAQGIVDAAVERFYAMDEAEAAAFAQKLDVDSPLFELEIAGESQMYRTVVLTMPDGSTVHYSLYLYEDMWMIAPVQTAK